MNKLKTLLENLVLYHHDSDVRSVEDGVVRFSGRQDNLAAIHVWIELPDGCLRREIKEKGVSFDALRKRFVRVT